MTKRSDASRDVAKQLRDVRKAQGMTQESLAELVWNEEVEYIAPGERTV